jgi:hypothetical protein
MHLFKQSVLALALGTGVVSGAQATVVFTFNDLNTSTTTLAGACSNVAWTSDGNFRMCDPSGAALGGGNPLHKDSMNGGETWTFSDTGAMTGVSTGATNPGTTPAGTASFPGSAAPVAGTNPALQKGAAFFGPIFNFLAPTVGSLAGNAYGAGDYAVGAIANGTSVGTLSFPVLEAQWGGTFFPLGQQGAAGIDFTVTITAVNAITGAFSFEMWANELIDSSEDPGAAGFTGWTAQWHMSGTGLATGAHAPPAVPVPAAVWLLGSGLLGLVGVARRKKIA